MLENEIEKQNTGFQRRKSPVPNSSSIESIWNDDASGKLKGYADFLTYGLVGNNENFVLNINGAWGTGKSFFIDRWIADLKIKNYTVIKFNAWENDCADDPLICLIAHMFSTFEKINEIEDIASRSKQALIDGIDLVAYGISSFFGLGEFYERYKRNIQHSLVKTKKIPNNLIDASIEKIKTTEAFKKILSSLSYDIFNIKKKPIIIFIDELDRCRPTFAIELLERIKHLFDIDYVKFVIVSNNTQLSASINSVYGEEFDSYVYLQKFFDQTFNLPKLDPYDFAKKLFATYNFKTGENELQYLCCGINDSLEQLPWWFARVSEVLDISLRTQEIAFSRIEAIIPIIKKYTPEYVRNNNIRFSKHPADERFDGIFFDLLMLGILLKVSNCDFFDLLFSKAIQVRDKEGNISIKKNENWGTFKNKFYGNRSDNEKTMHFLDFLDMFFGYIRVQPNIYGIKSDTTRLIMAYYMEPEIYYSFIEMTSLFGIYETK